VLVRLVRTRTRGEVVIITVNLSSHDTAQLNARARPWIWGPASAQTALQPPTICVRLVREVALSVKRV
jgi:hypothetical protein